MSSTISTKGACYICTVGVPQESERVSTLLKSSPTFKVLSELLKIENGESEVEKEMKGFVADDGDVILGIPSEISDSVSSSVAASNVILLCETCSVVVQDLTDLAALLEKTQEAIREKAGRIRNTFWDTRKGADADATVMELKAVDQLDKEVNAKDDRDIHLWKIEPDDSESTHSCGEIPDEFVRGYDGVESDDQPARFWIKMEESQSQSQEETELRLTGEETNEEYNEIDNDKRLLELYGLDKQPQPRVCLQRLKSSEVSHLTCKKLKRRRKIRKTKIKERIPGQVAEDSEDESGRADKLDAVMEGCVKNKKSDLQNDSDPDFVPSEEPGDKKEIKKRRKRKADKKGCDTSKTWKRTRRTPEEIKQLKLQASHNNNRLPCDICGKPMIMSATAMTRHQWSHKSEEEKQEWIAEGRPNPVKREERNKELARTQQPYKCETCGKRFPFLVRLQHHLERHKDKSERPKYVCEECGQIFYTKNGLRHHGRRKHNPDLNLGKWKYCRICPDVKFLIRTHLETHMMRHHGVGKKYICDQCGHRTPCKESLRKHMFVHLSDGSRPFKCEYCPMDYKHISNLHRHVQSSHPDKYVPKLRQVERPVKLTCKQMFPCEKCEKPFELLSRMKKHLLKCKE